jgi:hypothetical protein
MTRRAQDLEAERWTLPYDHAALTTTTTVKLYKVPAGRTLRLVRASEVNPTGLVGDGTNAFTLTIQNGATVANTVFNTNTGAGGASLAADTFVEGTPSATDANLVYQAGDIVSAVFTEDGTASLPAGHLVLEGLLF